MCYLHIQISISFASLLTQTSNFSIDNIKPDATCHFYFLINNLKIL